MKGSAAGEQLKQGSSIQCGPVGVAVWGCGVASRRRWRSCQKAWKRRRAAIRQTEEGSTGVLPLLPAGTIDEDRLRLGDPPAAPARRPAAGQNAGAAHFPVRQGGGGGDADCGVAHGQPDCSGIRRRHGGWPWRRPNLSRRGILQLCRGLPGGKKRQACSQCSTWGGGGGREGCTKGRRGWLPAEDTTRPPPAAPADPFVGPGCGGVHRHL